MLISGLHPQECDAFELLARSGVKSVSKSEYGVSKGGAHMPY
jgi:hypothetical protein